MFNQKKQNNLVY